MPLASTDPKRRFLGAVVALCDRGRKLYPDPRRRAGTSEAAADPLTSRFSMDNFDKTLNYTTIFTLIKKNPDTPSTKK